LKKWPAFSRGFNLLKLRLDKTDWQASDGIAWDTPMKTKIKLAALPSKSQSRFPTRSQVHHGSSPRSATRLVRDARWSLTERRLQEIDVLESRTFVRLPLRRQKQIAVIFVNGYF
jgi:hypothetical protein